MKSQELWLLANKAFQRRERVRYFVDNEVQEQVSVPETINDDALELLKKICPNSYWYWRIVNDCVGMGCGSVPITTERVKEVVQELRVQYKNNLLSKDVNDLFRGDLVIAVILGSVLIKEAGSLQHHRDSLTLVQSLEAIDASTLSFVANPIFQADFSLQ